MSKFKVGDRVKITIGPFCGKEATASMVRIKCGVYLLNVVLEDNPDNGLELACSEYEIELIPKQKPKTKTVRKYAVVMEFSDGHISTLANKYTEVEILDLDKHYNYHIIPTIFEDVEVPVETETRWTFICKNYKGDYYLTNSKYNSLDHAKSHTCNEAIAKIDDSAEEFEIE